MLHTDTSIPKVELCRSSIMHFERYLDAAADSSDVIEDADQIRAAIVELQSRVETYAQLDAVRSFVDVWNWNATNSIVSCMYFA